jgi:hypothetical protein
MRRDRLAIVDGEYLRRDIKIPEASLPSWLAEAALNGKFATIEELNNRAPQGGNGLNLTSPDGQSWRLTIGNDGALIATPNT